MGARFRIHGCVLYPDTNHYFTVLSYKLGKLIYQQYWPTKFWSKCEWHDFISHCTVYGCTMMVSLVTFTQAFTLLCFVHSLVFSAKYQSSVFVWNFLNSYQTRWYPKFSCVARMEFILYVQVRTCCIKIRWREVVFF